MAYNRYTQLSWSSLNELPMLQLPTEALGKLLAGAEEEQAQFDKLSSLTPKYIKNSKEDVALANQVRGYQQQLVKDLAETAATGNVNEYRQRLHAAKKNIADMWAEGGAANALESRLSSWEAIQKQVGEDFKENRRVGDAILGTYKFNNIDYDPNMRTYKGLGNATYYRDVKEEDIHKWFADNVNLVKETVMQEGTDGKGSPIKMPLDRINTIYDFMQIKGVSKDRLFNILQTLMPEDFKNSIYQREMAEKYYDPSRPDVNPYLYQVEKNADGTIKKDANDKPIFKTDKDGQPILDFSNPLARLYEGYASAGAYKKIDHDRINVKDELFLIRERQRVSDAAEKAKVEPTFETLPFITNNPVSPMMDVKLDGNGNLAGANFKLDEKGNLVKDDVNPLSWMGGPMIYPNDPKFRERFPQVGRPAIEIFRSAEYHKMFPEMRDAYNRYKNDANFKSLSDKDKSKILLETAQTIAQSRQTIVNDFRSFTGNYSQQERDNKQTTVLGRDGAIGTGANKSVYFVDQSGNVVSPNNYSLQDIANEYFGGDIAAMQKAARIQGELTGKNGISPAGDVFSLSLPAKNGVGPFGNKEASTVRMVVTNQNSIQSAIQRPVFEINSIFTTRGKDRSLAFVPSQYAGDLANYTDDNGVPIFNREVYARRADTNLSEATFKQANETEKEFYKNNGRVDVMIDGNPVSITSEAALQAHVDELKREADRLFYSPKDNKQIPGIELVDAETGTVIGGQDLIDNLTRVYNGEAVRFREFDYKSRK
jgi:hypothetical protein